MAYSYKTQLLVTTQYLLKMSCIWFCSGLYFLLLKQKMQDLRLDLFVFLDGFQWWILEHLTVHKNFIEVLQPPSSCFLSYSFFKTRLYSRTKAGCFIHSEFCWNSASHPYYQAWNFPNLYIAFLPYFHCLFFFFSLAIPCQPHPSFLTGAFLSRNVHLLNLKMFFLPGG